MMRRISYTSILGVTLCLGGLACGGSDDGGDSSSAGTSASDTATSSSGSVASCSDECRDYYDCQYSLCLLQGGSSCATQRINGLESCEDLTESDCTASLLSTYDSCDASDEGDGGSSSRGDSSSDGGTSRSGDSSSDGGSSGWGDSSSDGGTAGCLPPNSFCDFDSECCSGVCDVDFDFCH